MALTARAGSRLSLHYDEALTEVPQGLYVGMSSALLLQICTDLLEKEEDGWELLPYTSTAPAITAAIVLNA